MAPTALNKVQSVAMFAPSRPGWLCPQIAQWGPVKEWFRVLEAGYLISVLPTERRQSGRAADTGKQKVGAGIVTLLHRCPTHFPYRKGTLGQVRLCNRGVPVLDIGGAIGDERFEIILTTIDSGENASSERRLECAAHDEALVSPPGQFRAGSNVFCINTDVPTAASFIVRNCGDRGLSSAGGSGEEGRAAPQKLTSVQFTPIAAGKNISGWNSWNADVAVSRRHSHLGHSGESSGICLGPESDQSTACRESQVA